MTTVRNEKGKFQKKTEVENFKKDQPVNPRLAEIMKCSEDALYFIKNYCMIQHPQRGSIKLEPYPYQEDCIKAFQTNSKNIVLKSRQLGLSTITSAFVTWFSVFNQDKNILIVAIDFKTAANFLKKVKYMINKLPKILQFFHIKSENKDSITLSNGSVIKAVASTENAGRSEALSMLIMDEAKVVFSEGEIPVTAGDAEDFRLFLREMPEFNGIKLVE
jgi:phage terminase large subunit-like protein